MAVFLVATGTLAGLKAAAGIWDHLNATPITEGMVLMQYAERLEESSREGRNAWERAGGAWLLAEAAREKGDFQAASDYNLAVMRLNAEVKAAREMSKKYKRKGLERLEKVRKRFGDCETSAKAVDEAGEVVALMESDQQDYEDQVKAFMKAMGTYERYVRRSSWLEERLRIVRSGRFRAELQSVSRKATESHQT